MDTSLQALVETVKLLATETKTSRQETARLSATVTSIASKLNIPVSDATITPNPASTSAAFPSPPPIAKDEQQKAKEEQDVKVAEEEQKIKDKEAEEEQKMKDREAEVEQKIKDKEAEEEQKMKNKEAEELARVQEAADEQAVKKMTPALFNDLLHALKTWASAVSDSRLAPSCESVEEEIYQTTAFCAFATSLYVKDDQKSEWMGFTATQRLLIFRKLSERIPIDTSPKATGLQINTDGLPHSPDPSLSESPRIIVSRPASPRSPYMRGWLNGSTSGPVSYPTTPSMGPHRQRALSVSSQSGGILAGYTDSGKLSSSKMPSKHESIGWSKGASASSKGDSDGDE